MFIAHGPSGYILSSLVLNRAHIVPVSAVAVIASAVLGAVAPDFDLLYYHFIDADQTHHHRYFSHWPIFWLGLIALSSIICALWKHSAPVFLALVFSLGGFLHIILDSFVGDIWWFAPFLDKPFALFTVTARFKPWWLSFFLHWSFAAELIICLWAYILCRHHQSQPRGGPEPADGTPVVLRS